MAETASAIRNEQRRLTYLTRHYYGLQGVRLAPVWIAGIFVVLVWVPHYDRRDCLGWRAFCLALAGLVVAEVLWYGLVKLYYDRRFGWLKPGPLRFAQQKPKGPLFFLFWLALLGWGIYCRVNGSNAFFPYFIAALLSQPAFDAENPPIRRVYFGIGGGLIAACALLNRHAHLNDGFFFASLMGFMLAVGIADHMLLMSLRAPVPKDANG